MVFSVTSFLGGISAAIVVKLTSSIDDVLWLSAFLTPKLSHHERTRNAMTYASVCLFQTCLAFILSTFGEKGMEILVNDNFMSPDRILTILAGLALFVYAIFLGVEYYNEKYEQEDQVEYISIETVDNIDSEDSNDTHESEAVESQGDNITMTIIPTGEITMTDKPSKDIEAAGPVPLEIEDGCDNEEEQHRSDKESRPLAVIAFLGSLDDLTLFVPMLVGKTFGILELVIGTLISTLGIILICLFLTKCQLVADALEKVPLVLIVAVFCVVLIVKGVFFMD